MTLSKIMQSALAAVQRMKRGDPKVTADEVRKQKDREAALRRLREAREENERERDKRLH